MKKTLLIPLLLLAACGRGDPAASNQSAPAGPAGRESSSGPPADSPGGSAIRLAGLYEGGSGPQKDQMCIVEKGGETQFGLLVWGGNLHSCSGAGRAVRKGDRLTLTMTGDETCAIDATLKDGVVSLPAKLPLGCAYYCGARASLEGARFTRSGDDVKKAADIAGDPLCD
ncbi:MAG TPA: hypothetical protein VF535_08325 [Allosphingosinicella sp.]|jgi:hypothetical protein